jgi:signal transduction histidine kinase
MTAPAEQDWMADLGELTTPVAHEVNNFLNSLLLHLAVLDHFAPENMRGELTEIRRQGVEISGMLRNLQEYQNARQSALEVVDLNAIVSKTVQELWNAAAESSQLSAPGEIPPAQPSAPGRALHDGTQMDLHLTTNQLDVVGHFSELKRLCTFLVRNAIAAASGNGGSVTIRTERAPDRAMLRVEDTGPAVPPAKLAHVFEPHLVCRVGTNSLELAACQSLVRRLQGSIRAETGAEFGLKITVSLALASG